MKNWITPCVEIEKFEANEYVSACYFVKCDYHKSEPEHHVTVTQKSWGQAVGVEGGTFNGLGVHENPFTFDGNYTEGVEIHWFTGWGIYENGHEGKLTTDTEHPNRS